MPPSKFGWNFPFYNVMQLHTTIQSDTSVKLTVRNYGCTCMIWYAQGKKLIVYLLDLVTILVAIVRMSCN